MLHAIDPGSARSGFVTMSFDFEIREKGKLDNEEICDILSENCMKADGLVIEMPQPYQFTPKTVLQTCVWLGRFLQAFYGPSWTITRQHVRMYMCGTARSDDAMVRKEIIHRYGPPGTKAEPNIFYNDATVKMNNDIWQAYALGITFLDITRYKKLCDPRVLNKIERIR